MGINHHISRTLLRTSAPDAPASKVKVRGTHTSLSSTSPQPPLDLAVAS